jgi:polysaccharide pyruvyl transferase WcaK-like protein
MSKKKILILNDGSAYENWGIKACIDGLKNILENTLSDVELVGVPHSYMHQKYSWEPTLLKRKLFNEHSRIARRFLDEFHSLPKIADEFEYISELWLNGKGGKGAKSFIEIMNDIDIIIFNAEGSTYRDNIGAIKGLFMLWFSKTKLNKKAYFLNGSVTLTLVDSTLPAMIKKVFSVIDGVSVREPYSYQNILNFYPQLTNIKMYPDSVFSLNVDHLQLKDKVKKLDFLEKDFFCFSLSMLPMDYRRSRNKSSLVHIIKELKKIVPNAVLLAKDIEDQILKDVAKDTNSTFIGADFDYADIMGILSKAKFLFSGRYHHLIFATKVGCPCIPIASSSHKIHGFAELFKDIMSKPIDPTDIWEEIDGIIKNANDIMTTKNLKNLYIKRAKELEIDSMNHGYLINE